MSKAAGIFRLPPTGGLQLLRALSAALRILLLLALAVVAADLLFSVIAPKPLNLDGRPLIIGQPPASRLPSTYTALTGFDAFHRDIATYPDKSTAEAPETTLDLKLFGIRVAADADGGSAILRTPDHSQRAFTIGEEILPGVKLAAIDPQFVILVHDGRRETLFLGDSARRRARANGDASRASADDPQSEATPAGVDSIESTMQTAGLRLRPDFENGRMRGLHVIEIGSATLLKRNSLISGDVLLAVNGIAITSPAHAEAALRALSGAEEARVLIDRGGQERTLTVALDG